MPCIFGYTRISTDDIKQEYSLEGQAAAIDAGYEARRLLPGHAFNNPELKLIKPYFQDMASAWKKKFRDRPAGRELWRVAQRGDHVVVAMNDRAFRSPRDMYETLEEFKSRGISLHILNMHIDPTDPMGEMMLGIVTIMAKWESDVKSQRLKQANFVRKYVRGLTDRHPPMGWQWTKRPNRPTEPIPELEERRLGNYCLDIWLDDVPTEKILAQCLRVGKRMPTARRTGLRKCVAKYQALSVEYLDALIQGARWGFPLPDGAETGYIEMPKLNELGDVGELPPGAVPIQG